MYMYFVSEYKVAARTGKAGKQRVMMAATTTAVRLEREARMATSAMMMPARAVREGRATRKIRKAGAAALTRETTMVFPTTNC